MASKQLGKFRQWAGEKVSKDKSTLTDEFRELEKDVELRRAGIEKIYGVSGAYYRYLLPKKESDGKMSTPLPIEALGLALIEHGNDFGSEAAFGQCLNKMGRAHIELAGLQEKYAESFGDTFLTSLYDIRETMKEYTVQKKKLESRRLTYEAAMSKVSKSKKDKERKDAEEELKIAKARYEETSDDVQTRMYSIQDDEIKQLRDLAQLLDTEMDYVAKYQQILADVKKGWVDEAVIQRIEFDRPTGASHTFVTRRTQLRSKSHGGFTGSGSESDGGHQKAKEKERKERKAGWLAGTLKRGKSLKRKESAEKEPVDEEGRFKFGGNNGTLNSFRKRDKSFTTLEERYDEPHSTTTTSEKPSRSRRSLSMKSSSKRSNKGDEDEDEENERFLVHSPKPPTTSGRSLANSRAPSALSNAANSHLHQSPRPGSRSTATLATITPGRKVVKAVFDYNAGSPDELTLRVGDEIIVMEEFAEGWWVGELHGQQGLFPGNHTEEIRKRPAAPPRPPSHVFSVNGRESAAFATPVSRSGRLMAPTTVSSSSRETWSSDVTQSSHDEDTSGAEQGLIKGGAHSLRGTSRPGSRMTQRMMTDSPMPMDMRSTLDEHEDPEPFGDHLGVDHLHHHHHQPQHHQQNQSRHYAHPHDGGHSTGTDSSDADRGASGMRNHNQPRTPERGAQQMHGRAHSGSVSSLARVIGSGAVTPGGSQKKAAPPPPPSRRGTTASIESSSLPSSSNTTIRATTPSKRAKGGSHTKSPFGADMSDHDADGGGYASMSLLCADCGCDDFVQNRFKPRGHCSTCFHSHA